jgi:hypothetical protein
MRRPACRTNATRTQQLIDRADEQYLLLTLQTRGTGRVAQGDRRSLLHPAECAIFESHRPFELNFDAAFEVWVFGFPRHLVRLAEPERRQLAARSVNCRTGLAKGGEQGTAGSGPAQRGPRR